MRQVARRSVLYASLLFVAAVHSKSFGQRLPDQANDLNEELLSLSQKFHVSIVAEVKRPIPQNLAVTADYTSAAAALNGLLSKFSGYEWHSRDGVIFIERVKSTPHKERLLDTRLLTYTIPTDWSTFQLGFPNAVKAAQEHVQGIGGMVSGIPPAGRENVQLRTVTLTHVLARDVLMEVAKQIRPMVAVIVAPDRADLADEKWFITAP